MFQEDLKGLEKSYHHPSFQAHLLLFSLWHTHTHIVQSPLWLFAFPQATTKFYISVFFHFKNYFLLIWCAFTLPSFPTWQKSFSPFRLLLSWVLSHFLLTRQQALFLVPTALLWASHSLLTLENTCLFRSFYPPAGGRHYIWFVLISSPLTTTDSSTSKY